eukprot:3263795-Rhodomonas_salina.1
MVFATQKGTQTGTELHWTIAYHDTTLPGDHTSLPMLHWQKALSWLDGDASHMASPNQTKSESQDLRGVDFV